MKNCTIQYQMVDFNEKSKRLFQEKPKGRDYCFSVIYK